MKTQEYQAKQILRISGVKVPRGILATSPLEGEDAARQLGCDVLMVKVVPVGIAPEVRRAAFPARSRVTSRPARRGGMPLVGPNSVRIVRAHGGSRRAAS